MIDDLDVDQLMRLAEGITEAVRRRAGELAHLETDLETLDGCTGREWWRDRDNPTREAKLYLLHSIDAACPLHGKPSPGGRLRCYVGSDPARIQEAREAIEREARRADLERQAQVIRQELVDCEQFLQAFYDSLAGDLPEGSKTTLKEEKRTSIERAIAEALDWLGIVHQPQYRPDGSPWVFDEFVPPSILVEANGDYWHSSEKAQERDARKAAWAKGNGYRLVTIWEHEIKTEGARVLVTGRVIPALEIRQ